MHFRPNFWYSTNFVASNIQSHQDSSTFEVLKFIHVKMSHVSREFKAFDDINCEHKSSYRKIFKNSQNWPIIKVKFEDEFFF